jgi:predicted amidophosphoribosyltransferase
MMKHYRVIKNPDTSFAVDFLLHWVPQESDSLSELVYLLKHRLSFPAWKFYVEKFIYFHSQNRSSKLKTALIPIPGSRHGKAAYHTQYFTQAWKQLSPADVLDCLRSRSEQAEQKELSLEERGVSKMSFLEDFTTQVYQYDRIILIDDIVTSGHTLKASLMAIKPHLKPSCLIEIKALLSRDKI